MNNQAVSYDDHARVASQELAASVSGEKVDPCVRLGHSTPPQFAELQQSVEQLSQNMQALLQAAQEMLHSIQSLLETSQQMVQDARTERRDNKKRRARRDGARKTRSRSEPGSTNDGAGGSEKSAIEIRESGVNARSKVSCSLRLLLAVLH